jgi:hypothetical protein
LLAAVALVFALGACSGDDDDDAADQTADETADQTGADDEGDGGDTGDETADDTADGAGDDAAALQESLDDANATIEEQEATIAELNVQIETAQEAATEVQAQLAAETARADDAEAQAVELQTQIDAFVAEFPVTITASLEPYANSLIGAYNLTLTEAYCAALPTCGTQRPAVRADIIQGANGLELQVPNVFTTGLFMIEGSLFGVTDSNLIVPPCPDGTPVNSQVSTTIFADGITVEDDGTQTLSGLGASVLVAANPAGDCGPGNVFFNGTLTPA